ncbi:CBR-LSS-4 protein, partial [Loa loa]
QPSPLANGSYSNPGSVGIQKGGVKGKVAGRPDSRDVVFSPAAGQGGPPPQMPLHIQNSAVGTALPGPVRMEVPSSSSALGPQQMQQQVPNQQSMPPSAYSGGMYPSYWPPQQMRYMQPGNVHPGHYYPVQNQGPMPPSAFSGYGMPPGARQMMPTNSAKIQQSPQMEMPRMPNGPVPSDWQSRINASKSLPEAVQQTTSGQQSVTPSSGMPAPSPGGTSSAADESLEDSKSLPGASPNPWPHTPSQMSQGHRTPVPANRPITPTVNKRQDPTSIVDRLVGPVTAMNPQHIMPERRAFFEKLVQFCEQQGEPITQVPQVSKQTVDLHRLYLAVMKRGGFEQVTREKTWKQVCTEANSEMSESSAAERLKKRRKDNKDHNTQQYPGPGQPGPAGYGHLGDPNAAYFYGNVDPNMQGRLQGPVGWQPQGYPPGPAVTGPPGATIYHPGMRPSAPMRPPLPPQMLQQGPVIDEQQRYEEQQRQHYFHQQQAAYAVQLPRTTTPSSTLQVDSQQGQGSQSRAPSTGPPLATTPDSSSRHSVEDNTPLRPPSHPQQVPNATSSCSIPPSAPSQQQPSVAYYGQPHTPQMYGAAGLRPGAGPPGTLSMKTGGYHQTFPQSQPGYSHSYQEGYQAMHPGVATQIYQQQMWNSQQIQRYSGPHTNIPTSSSMGNAQMGAAMVPRVSGTLPPEMQQHYAARRPPFCLQAPGPAIPSAVSGTTTRLRYSAPPSNSTTHQQLQPQYPSHSMVQGGRVVGASSSPFPHMGPSTSAGFTGIHGATGSLGQSASALNFLPSGIHTPNAASGPGAAVTTVMHPSFAQSTQPQPMQFPAGSVEATTISQRRRRKLMMKDLMRVSTKRITMALRSGLETEITWALNALNIMLYDDYAPPTILNHTPGLLNVLVEHFRALLSLLYPKVFEVGAESKARTADDEYNEFWMQSSNMERTTAPSLVASRNLKNEPTNFTKVSRTGRTVHIEKKELPECLKRGRPNGWSCDIADETLSLDYHESRMLSGLGGETSSYLAARLINDIEFRKQLKKPRFFVKEVNGISKLIEAEVDEAAYCSKTDKSMRIIPSNVEKFNEDEYKKIVELKTMRPTALCVRDESRLQLVRRCLAVSNVLRGLSFLPGNEGPMARHAGLLYIIGRLLRLYTDERTLKLPGSLVKQLSKNEEINTVLAVGTLSEANRRLMEPGDLLESDDDNALLLFETACQLREDAFVTLVHVSVQLDLIEFESDVAWPLFDALIHWCVSQCAEAKDPLISAGVSPRNYALEALCKLSVIEHNVDLLLSTGPWLRLESFIKTLVGLLALNEEIPSREFAIVILCALCTISEPTCYIVAAESPAVHYLVAFLEMGDANMHQIAQQHGIQALRDNPEMMGTSVPMLRRAASILQQLCKVPACRQHLIRHQQRLLQFTMSHLMDSRVGQTITNVLYAMQYFSDKERESTEKGDESDEEGCQRKESKLSVRTNGDVKFLKNELESRDFPENNSMKRHIEHNGLPKVLMENADDHGDCLRQIKDEISPQAAKKQKLENGLLNYLPSSKANITSTSTPNSLKPLVNGDVKAAVTSIQAVSRSTPATPAGSVQAVA